MRSFATSKCSRRNLFQLPSSSLLLILTFLLIFHPLFAEIASNVPLTGETAHNLPNQKQKKTTLISHKFASSAAIPPSHQQHSRHRRRIPTGLIGRLIAKLAGKTGKAATTASRGDDVFVGAGKVGRISMRGKAPDRYYKPRGFDPPPFGSYALPTGSEMAKRAGKKALTGTNVALAAAGVGTGIWYFGGENAVLYIVLIVGGVLVVLILALSLLLYLFLCRKRKKGYYAVNEQMAAAFAKKVLFYLFC